MTGLSKPQQEVQPEPLRLMRLDVANSLLPFDRPLVDYLRGIAGTAYLLRNRNWHVPARFELSPTWRTVRSGLGLTALEDGKPEASGLELATLAASVAGSNGHIGEAVPPPAAGFLVEVLALEPSFGLARSRPVEMAWARWPHQGMQLPVWKGCPLRARLSWGPAPEPPASAAAARNNVRTFEPPPVPKVSIQAKESLGKQAVQSRPVVVPKPPARPLRTAPPTPPPDREARTPKPPEPIPPVMGQEVEVPPPPVVLPEPVKAVELVEPVIRQVKPPSFGGVTSTTLTGDVLRADQVEVPGVGGTVLKIGAPLVLALAGLGYYLFHQMGARVRTVAPVAQIQTLTPGDGTWESVPAGDSSGARHDRKLELYPPSKSWKNYNFQFNGQISSRALGWVVRARDSRNYYALKLSVDDDPSKPYTILKRWIVVDGRESSYSEKRVAIAPRVGTLYKVEIEVKGSSYDLSIQGKPVDLWTDNRLKGGAVGFMNERAETGRPVSAKIQRLETDTGK
ncbi:MAG: hypothetical protein ACKV22_27740 [Bryobacteraceae bacterium]